MGAVGGREWLPLTRAPNCPCPDHCRPPHCRQKHTADAVAVEYKSTGQPEPSLRAPVTSAAWRPVIPDYLPFSTPALPPANT